MEWAGHVAIMTKVGGAFKTITYKTTRTRPIGKPSRKWEGNPKMHRKEH